MSMRRKRISIIILIAIGFFISFFGMGCNDNGSSGVSINNENGDAEGTIRIGETHYTITTIDCFDSVLTVQGINDAGQIVGDAAGADINGYLYDQGQCTSIRLGTYTEAMGINNLEQIVGVRGTTTCNDIGVGSESFLWDKTTNSLTTLEVPGSSNTTDNVCGFSANSTLAVGINDKAQIVGQFTDTNDLTHGFLYEEGNYEAIDVPGASTTIAAGINNAGQIVGNFLDADGTTHGFLYSEGNYMTIDMPNATSTTANDINDAGQIVGNFLDADGTTHGFLYSEGNYMTIDMPNAMSSYALGINNLEQIVGYFKEKANGGIKTTGYMLTPLSSND